MLIQLVAESMLAHARGDYGTCPGCNKPLTRDDLQNQIDAETEARANLCVKCWEKSKHECD